MKYLKKSQNYWMWFRIILLALFVWIQSEESAVSGPSEPFGEDLNIYSTIQAGENLVTISSKDGHSNVLGSFDLEEGPFMPEIAFDVDGVLYGLMNWLSPTDAPAPKSQLATIDYKTGKATPVGIVNNINVGGMEIDAEGKIFTCGFHNPEFMTDPPLGFFGDTNLYNVDKETGELTLIGDTEIDLIMDLAFDSRGILWATTDNILYTIDPHTGKSNEITAITGIPAETEVMGIMFDENDTLYATLFIPDSSLYIINTQTGIASLVGPIGLDLPHSGDIFIETSSVSFWEQY